jgi:aspartyl-tRNA synthetase
MAMQKRIMVKETPKKVGEEVVLCGWVNARRDHGKVTFFDLKDRSGLVQVVAVPPLSQEESIKQIRDQWVLQVTGVVKKRPDNMVNKEIATGEVEIDTTTLKILNKAEPLPFDVTGDTSRVNEEVRLKYRYLDMRSERVACNLVLRAQVFSHIRNFMAGQDFTEVDTPYISKSTPEGARDYLVPSRIEKGKFYALPQSPQQYKQLLMVGGVDKYFQIARCFRDEDMRGDRQPEFTQLDVEMSFVDDEEQILALTEKLLIDLVKTVTPHKKILQVPFPRLTYAEAMKQYGTDKPDLRQNKNDPDELAFVIVKDFPMFEWKKSENRWDAVHHPFTRPKVDTVAELKKNPGDILAYQYDIALNGYEIAGGSLRSHDPKILQAVFEVMGHKPEAVKARFGHLLEAFSYGVPPHGGIAWGLDRLLMILANEPNIREVIPFPKASDGHDLMMASPSTVDDDQLKELGVKIDEKRK